MIKNNIYWEGVRHIFSPNVVSKYELCDYINEIYDLNIKINKNIIENKNISLLSIYNNPLCELENIKKQIEEQKEFNILKCGNYKILNCCKFCNNNLIEIFKYNEFPLVGAFMKNIIH
jgi:hypothetical protein